MEKYERIRMMWQLPIFAGVLVLCWAKQYVAAISLVVGSLIGALRILSTWYLEKKEK